MSARGVGGCRCALNESARDDRVKWQTQRLGFRGRFVLEMALGAAGRAVEDHDAGAMQRVVHGDGCDLGGAGKGAPLSEGTIGGTEQCAASVALDGGEVSFAY